MKRYFNSFFITLVIYIFLFLVFIFSMSSIKQKTIKTKSKISLTHISLVHQKKVIKKEKKVLEKLIKKQEKKELIKKITRKKTVKKVKRKKIIKKIEKKAEKIPEKLKNNIIVEKIVNKKKDNIKIEKLEEIKKSSLIKDYKKEFINNNLEKIIALIQKNIKYPKRARIRHIEGLVKIEFRLNQNKEVSNFKIIEGNSLLAKATIKAIKMASYNFPIVKRNLHLRVPILYKLK